MRRGVLAIALASVACTDVSTDPNAIVGLRFDGSSYPSIVAGDSLRDSLGALQPLRAAALNYKGDAVPDAAIVFSSPDTILRMFDDGVVFARGRKTDATPARVFATAGSLQSQPDSLFTVVRADSMDAAKDIEPLVVGTSGGTTGPDSVRFLLFGDTVAGAPKVAVSSWLVSFQLRYRGVLLSPTDTSVAYTFEASGGSTPRRIPTFIDTTDATGKASRRVFVRTISTTTEDTIFLVATARRRTLNAAPLASETMILLRRQ